MARIALLLSLVPSIALAQLVFPGGNVANGTTWGVPGVSQTVTLNGDVTIPVGATLTILPGAVITAGAVDNSMRMGGTALVDIFVEGTLTIQEMVGTSVTFTGPSTSTASWGGFLQLPGSTVTGGSVVMTRMSQGYRVTAGTGTTTLTLNRATMGTGVCLRTLGTTGTTSYTLSNSTLSNCVGTALDHGYGTLGVTQTVIRNATGAAVFARAPGLSLDRSTVSYNGSYGVVADCGVGSVTVTNSIITHNSSYGFLRGFNCSLAGSLTVSQSNNLVWGNSGTSAAATPTTGANLDSNNYSSVGAGNALSANPLFVDGPGGNLRLTSRSAARQPGGTDLGAVPYTGDVTAGGLQGYLWADTMPTLSGMVSVVGDVTVPAGVTVTIAAGTTLSFAASDAQGSGTSATQAELFVLGTLQAVGTVGSTIAFTTPTPNTTWGGLRLRPGGSASIAQARFDHMAAYFDVTAGTGTTTLTMNNATLGAGTCLRTLGSTGTTAYSISNTTFAACTGTALDHSYGTLNVNQTVIRGSTGAGVFARAPGLTIDRSTVSSNASYGVVADCGVGAVTVTNSIVSHNMSYGFLRGFNCSLAGSLTVMQTGNVVWGNSGTAQASTPTTGANLDTNNYSSVSAGNALSANPLFVDLTGGNLRLTSRSVARQPGGTDLGALPYTGDATQGGLQGYLWSDTPTTLSGAVSVVGDVTVPAGVTVTISPGTTLNFANSDTQGSGNNAAQAEFFVAGTLQAVGSISSPIVFTTSTGTWGGVRVRPGASVTIAQGRFDKMAQYFDVTAGTGTTTVSLSNASLGAGTCLRTLGSSGTTSYTLTGVTFANCTGSALDHGYGTLGVSLSVFRNGTGAGVFARAPGLSIDRSTLSYNASYGVVADCGVGAITLTNSIISHNLSYGILRGFNCSLAGSLTVDARFNDVWGNSGTGTAMPPTGASLDSNNYSSVTPGTGSQSQNPLFTNGPAMPADLTLTSTSPAIGAGRVGGVSMGQPIDQGAFPYMVGPIVAVVVTPSAPSLAAGAPQTFIATAYDSNSNQVPTTFTWSATAAAGTITPQGVLTANCTPGTAMNGISAAAPNGVVGRTSVTIVAGAPNNLLIAPSAPTVRSQATQGFTATVRDACNNVLPSTNVVWSVASQAGTITPMGSFTAGCARATYANAVTATSGSITASTAVTVAAGEVAAVSLTPQNPSVPAAMTQLFSAVAADGCGNTVMGAPLTWSTTAPQCSINAAGIFTAGQINGTTMNGVTVSTPGASAPVTASTGVTVTGGTGATVATVTLTPTSTSLAPNGTQQFVATARDSGGMVLTGLTTAWSVVGGGGTISNTGLFTAGTTAGSFTNTVQATIGGVTAATTVTVTPGPLATLTVLPAMSSVAPGGTVTFMAQGADAFGNTVPTTVTWTANPSAGSISSGGVFTAGNTPGVFSGAVTATSGSVTGTANVTVQAGALASLTITPQLAMVQAGATTAFTVVGRDGSGNAVSITPTWSVVNAGGTINASGIFTAGTVAGTFGNTVRVQASNLTAFASVVVSPGPVLAVTITPQMATVASGATQQFVGEARDAFNNVVPVGVTWMAAPAAGSINAGGVFTAGATPGVFSNAITGTVNGVNGFASVTVTGGMGGGAGGSGGAGGTGGTGGGSAGGAGGSGGGATGGSGGGAMGGSGGGEAGGVGGGATGGAGGGMVAQGGGVGGGEPMPMPNPTGCGCSSGTALQLFGLLALVGMRRRRR